MEGTSDREPSQVALSVANHIPAMVAYWDSAERCVFSNAAYQEWFGRSPREMVGMSLKDLLGALYPLNLPHIRAALRGERQVFERRIPLPGGGFRDSIATYTPDIAGGVVQGFFVHVADVTALREREAALEQALRERDSALAEVRVLRGLLPICAHCKCIRDENGRWEAIERFVTDRSEATFSHGICPNCVATHYSDFVPQTS